MNLGLQTLGARRGLYDLIITIGAKGNYSMLTALMIQMSICDETHDVMFNWTEQPGLYTFLGEVATFNGRDICSLYWIDRFIIPNGADTFDYDEEDMVALFASDERIKSLKGILIFGFDEGDERAIIYVVNGRTVTSLSLPHRL